MIPGQLAPLGISDMYSSRIPPCGMMESPDRSIRVGASINVARADEVMQDASKDSAAANSEARGLALPPGRDDNFRRQPIKSEAMRTIPTAAPTNTGSSINSLSLTFVGAVASGSA